MRRSRRENPIAAQTVPERSTILIGWLLFDVVGAVFIALASSLLLVDRLAHN
jgi:hypothetical protein